MRDASVAVRCNFDLKAVHDVQRGVRPHILADYVDRQSVNLNVALAGVAQEYCQGHLTALGIDAGILHSQVTALSLNERAVASLCFVGGSMGLIGGPPAFLGGLFRIPGGVASGEQGQGSDDFADDRKTSLPVRIARLIDRSLSSDNRAVAVPALIVYALLLGGLVLTGGNRLWNNRRGGRLLLALAVVVWAMTPLTYWLSGPG